MDQVGLSGGAAYEEYNLDQLNETDEIYFFQNKKWRCSFKVLKLIVKSF